MWVSQPSPTSCTASLSRRGSTSHSWWQVWGFWRGDWWWVLKRPWLSPHLTWGPGLSTGESGLGKSTLINSLFLTNLYADRQLPEASGKTFPTLSRHPAPLQHPQMILFLSIWVSQDFLGDSDSSLLVSEILLKN